jgi:hypothetical protein
MLKINDCSPLSLERSTGSIKVVAVKKLVVGFVAVLSPILVLSGAAILGWNLCGNRLLCRGCPSFTAKKSARSKQAYAVECISMQ